MRRRCCGGRRWSTRPLSRRAACRCSGARCGWRRKRRCWRAHRPCGNGTPTARTSVTTPRAVRRPANSGTTISIPSRSRLPSWPAWTAARRSWRWLTLDEIRGRLAEVFALKNHKIDHVVHGAIASAAVYGAVLGASVEQIESAIGLVVAHYIPFRAIRHGHQLSDSKGASAAISAEVAVLSMRRAMRGFVGPADIFRNPQAIFCLFEPPSRATTRIASPFDLCAGHGGRRLRRDGHALQAGAVRAPIGRRDPRRHRPDRGGADAARRSGRSSSTCESSSTNRRSASSATRPSATRTRGKAPTTRCCTSWPRCCGRRMKRGGPAGTGRTAGDG